MDNAFLWNQPALFFLSNLWNRVFASFFNIYDQYYLKSVLNFLELKTWILDIPQQQHTVYLVQ